MSTPPIQYSAPTVAPDVDWEVRRHLQLIYQKLGNHVQAMSLLTARVNAIKTNSTTTSTAPSGGASVPISLGGVNNQEGVTSYETTPGDDGVVLLLNDASPVAVTLNSSVNPNFYLTISNAGAGLVTMTPTTGTINGGATSTIPQNGVSIVIFDGTNWFASAVSAPSGFSGTITTAKLTTGGSNGSMTYVAGVLTSQTPAT